MRTRSKFLIAAVFCLWFVEQSRAAAPMTLIPQPTHIETQDGVFCVTSTTTIRSEAAFRDAAQFLADKLATAMGRPWNITLLDVDKTPSLLASDSSIVLKKVPATEELGDEGYRLTVAADGVRIEAATPAGAFYACQTLRQLLPPEIECPKPVKGVVWSIPRVRIVDRPRFAWRGMMLDSARHFQSKDVVKWYIDLLAYHKMNRLHWHLTDDQGWRVEIKKYPRLTEVGAWRPNRNALLNRLSNTNDQHYGGFYTQADLREIVAFAASRHVTIVPEIEMPGHCLALIAAYPEFCCTGKPVDLGKTWITQDVCCIGNDRLFQFFDDVLTEIVELFPSPWIHIGGDECPKVRWKACPKCQARMKSMHLRNENELQSYFVRRVEKIIEAKGRRLIGWDEILEGGLAHNATVQSWRGMNGGLAAAREGHDVVMSPTSHCYLDYSHEVTPVRKSYEFEPIPAQLEAVHSKHVLGIEGCMWLGMVSTRYLLSTGKVLPVGGIDAQAFPRIVALAEVGWSPKDARNWPDFKARLIRHGARLEKLGVKFTRDATVWDANQSQ